MALAYVLAGISLAGFAWFYIDMIRRLIRIDRHLTEIRETRRVK